MISYIVATHDRAVLDRNLLSTEFLDHGDELIVLDDMPSIAVAYNEGTRRATNPIRCYVHHDVVIKVDADGRCPLREALLMRCTPDRGFAAGMVGVIGSFERAVPWWEGEKVGTVVDARIGVVGNPNYAGPCAYLDGLLLATTHDVEWDQDYAGWHWYDHDICEQMLRRGLKNAVVAAGHTMVTHNTTGSLATRALPGWHEGMARFTAKWGEAA